MRSTAGGNTPYGAWVAVSQISTGVLNLYGGSYTNTVDKAEGAVSCFAGTLSVYGSVINGSGATAFDVKRTDGTLTLYAGTNLLNNKTDGTITYGGTVVTSDAYVDDDLTVGDDATINGIVTLKDQETADDSANGIIYKGATRFIHNFRHPTGDTARPAGGNTFVGLNAGNLTMGSTATNTAHGSYNVAVGTNSLTSNTTGYSNSAVGVSSLTSNTTGNSNSAVGLSSLRSNTTGNSNSAVGTSSGRYISGGAVANATSSTSVYLGALTKALADGGTNEIVIGYDATGAGSNTATLGNTSVTKTVLQGAVHVDSLQLKDLNAAPANATDTGTKGEIRIDADYIYVCVDTDTWKRVAIATWE